MFSLRNIFPKHRVIVLMYHRIADVDVDPWDLAVSKNNFEEHVDVIREHVIALPELVHQLKRKRIEKSGFCITFDDGYADNFLNAKPVLEKHECPATFFIASGFTGISEMFWWDVLTAMFLEMEQLPEQLDITINNENLHFNLENGGRLRSTDLEQHKAWRWPDAAPTQRCEVYLKVWQAVRDLPSLEISNVIAELVRWSGFSQGSCKESVPMNEQQLASLASPGLFSFGVHSVNHNALAAHSADLQRSELTACRRSLSGAYKNFVNAVAYPYGNYNKTTTTLMQEENFDAGFTTQEKAVSARSNIYELGRIKIGNLGRKEFQKLVRSWQAQ